MNLFEKLSRRALLITMSLCTLAVSAAADNGIRVDNTVTPERKVISLRTQMDTAATSRRDLHFLKKIAKVGTFQAYALLNTYDRQPSAVKKAKAMARKLLAKHPEYQGFTSMFNGRDLTGWKGLVENPIKRAQMSADELARKQVKADEQMRRDWKVIGNELVYVGTGFDNLCSVKQYGDFEMYVDWQLDPDGKEPDAGIYLRGTPQVQIWDTARVNVGAQVGSGGLYNNKAHQDKPLVVADNAVGEWNTFYIKMVGDRVTVRLNGILVVDNVVMDNYWDRSRPIFPREQIELQAHGSRVYFRDIYIREL